MRRFHFIAALLLLAAVSVSCKKDDDGIPTSEANAAKGDQTSMIGYTANGQVTEGSAFMYKRGQTLYFLLCEGEARSWSKAYERPHLEIHIWESYVVEDLNKLMNATAYAIDITSKEKKVYVCWVPGNGERFFDVNNYAVATGNYKFDSGSVLVSKTMGMYTISFSGSCTDGKTFFGPSWAYTGAFANR